MWSRESLEIIGRGGRFIHNRFYAQEEPAEALAVVVAGFAYTIESPYLFYSKHAPFLAGSDVVTVDFEYGRNEAFLNADAEERERWFNEDIGGLADYLRGDARYRRLSMVGKSLGTTVVFRLLQDPAVADRTDCVAWLTPGEMRAQIASETVSTARPTLLVYGERDPYAEDAPLERLADNDAVDLMVVPGADHALETDDPHDSVAALQEYLRRLERLFRSVSLESR